jgi:peptide/nickel transport system ATP-binding protein
MPDLLAVEDLTLSIAGVPAVEGVGFAVRRGEVLALVGESGCGKSLTALSILGLLPSGVRLARGSIRLEGRDLAHLPERELRRLRGNRISVIFQEPTASLDPLSTVGAQIAEALTIHQRVGRAEARSRALEMLAAVGIPDPVRRARQYPFELSGGMCQRIMIAIALICGPALLLADEPTTALDVTIQAQILDLLRELVAKQGTSVLLITHDMGVVADIADRVAVMYAGHLVEVADAESVFRMPGHPYTALLLASVPRLDHRPKAPLLTIDGTVPMPHEMGGGCRFASRCPLASEQCRAETPPLIDRGDGHSIACWHADAVPRLVEAGR